MGIFSRLFDSDKVVNDITDKDNGILVRSGEWIGNLAYTDEEKAEAAHEVRRWAIEWMQALAPFKVVQRIIAFTTMSVWAVTAINVIAAIWIDKMNPCYFYRIVDNKEECVPLDVTTPMLEFALSDFVLWPVVAVLGLYMSGGVLPALFGKKKADS